MNKLKAALAGLAICLSLAANAQFKSIPSSPTQTVKQSFALGEISYEYSRPSIKGRTIFGDLVPYGKPWRTGANGSTKLTFSDDVKLEGHEVKAGTYALYTIPAKDSWTVVLSKDLNLGGNMSDYKPESEVTRFNVKPYVMKEKVETFSILVDEIKSSSAVLELIWENILIPINITTDVDAKMMKNIDAAIAKDSRPYFEAANYYYENNKDLNKAYEWINKAVESNPKAYWQQLLKAKIELKLGKKKEAIATADKVEALAKEGKNDDYVAMAQKLKAEAKK